MIGPSPILALGNSLDVSIDNSRDPSGIVRALQRDGRPALFQYGQNCFGFTGHPGAKLAMIEDLIMEFDDAPGDPAPGITALRHDQDAIADSLVYIMTGLIQMTGLMATTETGTGSA